MEQRRWSFVFSYKPVVATSISGNRGAAKVVTLLRARSRGTLEYRPTKADAAPLRRPNIPDDAYIYRPPTAAPKTIPNNVFAFPAAARRVAAAAAVTGAEKCKCACIPRTREHTRECVNIRGPWRRRRNGSHFKAAGLPARRIGCSLVAATVTDGEKCRRLGHCSGRSPCRRIFKRARRTAGPRPRSLNLCVAFHVRRDATRRARRLVTCWVQERSRRAALEIIRDGEAINSR